jgi:hypothetical protein
MIRKLIPVQSVQSRINESVTEVKNMKRIGITLCLLIFTAIATVAKGGSPAARTLVVGTGHPEVDVPAVQAAVDLGVSAGLKGSHFGRAKRSHSRNQGHRGHTCAPGSVLYATLCEF